MTATLRKPSPLAALDALLGRRVSMRSMALLRVFAGPIVLLHLRPFLGRYYADTFYEPYASWYPEAPRGVYTALLWIAVVAAVFMCVGLFTRVATTTTFAIVTYNLFLSTTHFHNNRAYLVIVLAALALAPCGREISVDAWRRRRRGLESLDTYAAAWPLWLLRFECAAVYAASGTSKLLDPDWLSGTVSYMRTVESKPDLDTGPLPSPVISILTNRDFHTFAAKLVIATELFIALGLWSRRTRYAAVWVAVIFHVSIQLSAAVEVFSILGIAVLVIWAVPSTRDRVLVVDRRWHAVIRWLDWLARFRLEPGAGPAVVDRDGRRLTGAAAVVLVLSRLPLTAWFALPARLVLRA